jgi:hypothetical protein
VALLTTCPSCGLESAEIRCPRCNALKLRGCDGACTLCAKSCSAGPVPSPPSELPSQSATEDAEHPGTPLVR